MKTAIGMNSYIHPLLPVALLCLFFRAYHVQGLTAGFEKKSSKLAARNQTPLPSYVVDESTSPLVKYLVDVECEGIESLAVGRDIATNLRGLFAKESFQEGEYICAIPFVSTVLLDETFFSKSEPQEDSQLAAYRVENAVRFLQKVVKNAENTPLEAMYRESLPLSGDDSAFSPTPDFWSEPEIKELQVPSIVQDLLERKELVRSRVQRSENSDDDDIDVTEAELRHALWLVRSRAFTTLKEAIDLDGTEGLLQRTVMVPYLDFLNHQRIPNAVLEVVESKAYEESFYALVAKRSIQSGEEVTICYGTGDEASWDLYTQYGFWTDQHEANDSQQLPEVTEWTTTMEQDLEQLDKLPKDDSSVTRAILNFRIRIKKAERNRSIGP